MARIKESPLGAGDAGPLRSIHGFDFPSLLFAATLAGAGALGCEDSITGQTPEGEQEPVGTIGEDDIPAPSTRFRRLTHDEWANTATDLFAANGTEVQTRISTLANGFLTDPVQGGFIFEGNGDSLEVDSARFRAYQIAAQAIAFEVVSDPDLFAQLVPTGANDDERGAAFIRAFGEKAHRRPLTPSEVDAYSALFELGQTSYTEHSGLTGGVRLVIEGALQSPLFLYRVEQSDDVERGVVPLDGYERASRLSYFFWRTMPDEELFEAAREGALDSVEGVRTQAARLVASERARETVIAFFEKVLEVERYGRIAPSSSAFPDVTGSDLSVWAEEETAHFLGGVMYDDAGTLRDFLTSKKTFVNQGLASIYGLEGSYGEDYEPVELNAAERSGIFTQVGFLASHATSVDPDPIHRGVFLARRVNCIPIKAPPDAVPPLPSPNGQSNRQLVTEHTEAEGTSCRNCHSTIINPFGFAYEHYDAIGAFRTEDRTHPVDAQTEVPVDGGTAVVKDAVELSEVLAESKSVHECLSGHLLSFAQGRDRSEEDVVLIEELGSASLERAASFRDLMVEVAVADSFLNRSKEVE